MMKKCRLVQIATMTLSLLLLFSLWSFAQTSKIRGTVSDDKGAPMVGVTVVVKGTTTGTVTDANGGYQIDVPSKATLTFSFIGYTAQDVPVGNKTVVDVKLLTSDLQIEDVVVVGYGIVKKKDLTGAVASVSSEALVASSPTTVQKALQGKTAGVVITQGTGVNASATIRIRGNRSISANNDPLFVIDGVPSSGGIETINPGDIESIDVLKDASSTAIYGARGANGVILVTTKKGEVGKVSVQYDGYTSVGYRDRYQKTMSAAQYVEFVRDGARRYTYDGNGGYAIDPAGYASEEANYDEDMSLTYLTNDPYVTESLNRAWEGGVYNPAKLRSFNWQEAGFRDHSVSQNHSLSIRGGTDKTQVFLSGSFLDAQDIALQSYNKRYTMRMNIDQKLGDRFTMGGSVNFSYRTWDNGKGIPTFWNPLATPYVYTDPTQNGDPALGLLEHPGSEPLQYNSFYDLTGVKYQNKNNRLQLNIYGEAKIVKGLTYRANFGTSLNIQQEQRFYSHYSTSSGFGKAQARQAFKFDRSWTFENILTYNARFNDHSLTATLVQANEKYVNEPATVEGIDLPIETQLWYALGSATTQSVSSGYTQSTLMSYMGRVNYSYKGKYLATAALRYDGASRLSEGHKWVMFPSGSIAWRISDEDFLQGSDIISNLKLRLSYGATGNYSVNPYSTIGKITSSRYNWGKTEGAMGYAPSSLNSPALTWETTGQYNIGLDLGFLNNRISSTIELYRSHTNDLLLTRSLPTVSGFGSITQNVGETQNQGIEVSINTINIDKKKFKWTTDLTGAYNKEEIVALATGKKDDIGNKWFIGYPVATFYDYVAAPKVWGYSKEDMDEMAKFNANGSNYKPGDLRLVDFNGDYKITDVDRKIRGSRPPKYTYSITNNFTYGPFDLYVFMHGAAGYTVNWDPGYGPGGRYNTVQTSTGYWTPNNTETKFIAPHTDMQMPSNVSAMYFWKGDFLKVDDITFGYTLPSTLTKRVQVKNVRVYAKVQNPFIITKFEGNDPEGSIGGGGDQGWTMKTYMFGLNLTF